jgi:TM2 domain-containing membrane protein YozV
VVRPAYRSFRLPPKPYPPWQVAMVSLCGIAGLGQMLLGQVAKGLLILIVSVLLGVYANSYCAWLMWVIGGIDAYLVARKAKNGKPIGKWECF